MVGTGTFPRHMSQNYPTQLNLTTNGLTGVDLHLPLAGTITGHICAQDGITPLVNCLIGAEDYSSGNWIVGTRTGGDGGYTLTLPAGSYRVCARPSNDGLPFMDSYYPNTPSRAAATPVVVNGTNNTPGIDFVLSSGCTISGHIYRRDNGQPLENCNVSANDYDSNNWMGGMNTDAQGGYTLRLPPGAYRVRADPGQNGLLYESKFYYDTYQYQGAGKVTVNASNNAAGIDFILAPAGTVSGHIFVGTGNTPLANCNVGGEDSTTGEWTEWDNTANDGSYRIVLPVGSYRVKAAPSNNRLPYVDTWYSNALDRSSALIVTVTLSNATGGIDFHLGQSSYIQGRATDQTTGQPIVGIPVYANRVPDTNNFWINWVYYGAPPTDSNGYYSIPVSPGSNYIIQTDSGNSFYPFRCWSNQVDRSRATLVAVGPASTASNINFEIAAGGRITGHIYREEDGAPLGNCGVYASDFISGQWVNGRRTDSSGYYSMAVPAAGPFGTPYRIAATPQNDGLPYANGFFKDATDYNSAQPVQAQVLQETGGIDFHVMVNNLLYSDWKAHYFTATELADPSISGDNADPDHDGSSNYAEYLADTNPRQSNSVLRVTGHDRNGGLPRIQWKGGRWARQYLERSDSLATNSVWTTVQANDILPTVTSNFVLDADAAHTAAFYRIRAER